MEGLGVSMVRGIESRPRAAAQAGARAPWRVASACRLVELGRGAARRARRRRGDGARRWRAHHGRPRVGAQPAKRHWRAAAGMPLCSARWSTACVRELGCARLSSSVRWGVAVRACSSRHSWTGLGLSVVAVVGVATAQRAAAGLAPLALPWTGKQRREREKEGGEREKGQPKFDSN